MRRSGIYLIQNIITKDVYVGSSRNVFHRRDQHFHDLRNGIHGNSKLQNSYNKYGEENFIFSVIEDVAKVDDLVTREQHWMDTLSPEFNILKTANNNTIPVTESLLLKYKRHSEIMTGRKVSDETRKKMSIAHLERYQNPDSHIKLTPEQKAHLSEINTGEKNPNWGTKRPEHFKKMIGNLFASIEYTFTEVETGKEVKIRNIRRYCRENNLNYNALGDLGRGARKSPYNGWVFKSKEFIGYNK